MCSRIGGEWQWQDLQDGPRGGGPYCKIDGYIDIWDFTIWVLFDLKLTYIAGDSLSSYSSSASANG